MPTLRVPLAWLFCCSLGAYPACERPGSQPEPDAAAAPGDARPGNDGVDAGDPEPPPLRYNQIRQKSAHNSYQRDEAHIDQLVYHRLRSLEFDLHVQKNGERVAGDWFVYHNTFDRGTTCHMLSDCLAEMRAFDRAQPDHEVVTLWIDLKDPFENGYRPEDLDALLAASLPVGDIVSPTELLQACPEAADLKAAVTGGCGWPSLDAMRGRFIFALTGGGVADSSSRLSEYLDADGTPEARLAFVAPDLTDSAALTRDRHVIFYNMNAADTALADDVFASGYVGRVWDVNSQGAWNQAISARAHHIATDKVNYHADPWALTHDERGWPFQCIEACDDPGDPSDPLLRIEVNSGDIWERADSFWFLYSEHAPGRATSWSTFVSSANSHMDEWAKGCLMARLDSAADAPYFAVCRPADRHRLRVQMRTARGGESTATEAAIAPADTIDAESVAFIRMDVDADARCATGLGSTDGQNWVAIAQQCFAEPLTLQGLAASSHDSGAVALLFGQLTRVRDSAESMSAASFENSAAIGPDATGSAMDL